MTVIALSLSDDRLRRLRDEHYAGGVGGRTVGPPGRRLGFGAFNGSWGWVSHWPNAELTLDGYDAFRCTLFRREPDAPRASDLIRLCLVATERQWGAPPRDGWLTYVKPSAVASANPGYCFKVVGFRFAGRTQGGLHRLILN